MLAFLIHSTHRFPNSLVVISDLDGPKSLSLRMQHCYQVDKMDDVKLNGKGFANAYITTSSTSIYITIHETLRKTILQALTLKSTLIYNCQSYG